MDLLTAQMSMRWEAYKAGLTFVDTTVKSGTRLFAPTWEIVLAVKGGEISEAEYTEEYRRLMRVSYQQNQTKWDTFIRQEDTLVLACYCKAGEFCHRHLLKDFFEKLCQKQGLPFYYYGEFTKNSTSE